MFIKILTKTFDGTSFLTDMGIAAYERGEIFSEGLSILHKPISCNWFLSKPPENIKKLLLF